ncbi:hypothetical protein A7J71_11320 [Achromobacter insolitus]|uniref:Bbp16 family capsid cement protein n=1 Tax=Achromobacter insolitus TaxID=217204 RepID=UPI0007C6397D|nr:hypothetical protein [Achromobacter insolitus]OAE72602.1 hypothetical protein A7J71_11320 [Achromobacter insolitus]
MLIDSRLEFSVNQVLAAAGNSTNVVDLSSDRDIGPGQPMYIVVTVGATVAADTTVTLQTSAAEAFGSPVALGSIAIPTGTPAGAKFVLGMPYTNQRYLRLAYSAAITASAFLTSQEPASWQAYPGVV